MLVTCSVRTLEVIWSFKKNTDVPAAARGLDNKTSQRLFVALLLSPKLYSICFKLKCDRKTMYSFNPHEAVHSHPCHLCSVGSLWLLIIMVAVYQGPGWV